ncbi:HNH endonuclease [Myxosarcina sp. GI1]|uniref:HNH endonuclease n=1 Tax=Myxosarcina sp. GI1 TaxID=1541065 RepID=UPI000B13946F|nr:HNH endonuclease signature motif containing protein [Myxosarcina sp. GI1]
MRCERANDCCEYCLVPEAFTFASHEIDHIIARKHGGKTKAENLALSCTNCNRHKGSDIASIDPEMNELTPLYHPRKHRWQKHFRIQDNQIIPLTSKGRVTVLLLQFNLQERIEERKLLIEADILKLSDT